MPPMSSRQPEELVAIFSEQNRQKIIEAVLEGQTQPRFAALVSTEDVVANDYLLLPASYVGLNRVDIFLGSDVQWVDLNKIANVFQGNKLGKYPKGNIPVIQGRDLTVPGLQMNDLEKKDVPQDLPKPVYSQAGDILIQRIGQSPRAFLVEEELAGINLNDTVYIIRFHEDDRLRSRYLVEFLNSSAGQAQLLSTNIGGAVIPTLRLTGLRKLKVAIPNRAVVELIRTFMTSNRF